MGIDNSITRNVEIDEVKIDNFKEYIISSVFNALKISEGFGTKNNDAIAKNNKNVNKNDKKMQKDLKLTLIISPIYMV